MLPMKPYDLRRQAEERLQQATFDPKKLVLLHTAIALGASLLVTALNFLLSHQIAGTGGLSGMPLRSVLSTVQSVLELAIMVALPFWEIGLLFAALFWARGETAYPKDLLQGFRRFGPVLRLRLLQAVVFLALGIAVSQISSIVFMLTPFAKPLLSVFEPVMHAATAQELEALLTPAFMAELAKASIPLMVLFGVLYALLAIPLFYRLRFAEFAVMEGSGAVKAMLASMRMTRKNCLQILKVDLSFWWFYLLQVLCAVVCYLDAIFAGLGIALPFSADVSFFLFYIAGTVLQGALLWQCQAKVLTTYCLTYQALGDTAYTSENPVPWQA